MQSPTEAAWRSIQAATVLLVLGFFLFTLRSLLSPFVLFWILALVLLPFRGTPGYALLLVVSAALTVLWVLDTTGFLLAPFVLSLVLAYVLDPLVDRLEGRRVGRSLAILLLAVPVLLVLAAGVVFGVPSLAESTRQLIERAPEALSRIVSGLEALRERVLRVDLPLVDEEAFLERLRAVDSAAVVQYLEARMELVFSGIWSGVLGLGRGLGSFFSILGYVVLTPVLTFYILRDYDGLTARVRDLIPLTWREEVVGMARDYDRLLSRYLRGQVTVALLMGAITAVGLLVLRFPHAIALGVLVAVFSVVPYLGLVLSLLPALFIALVSGSVGASLLKVAVVYGASQALESAVISPRIVGDSVGLHPVWVVLALAVGGFFFGFVGLLIAMPVAVGVKLLVVRGVDRYRKSNLYRGGTPVAS